MLLLKIDFRDKKTWKKAALLFIKVSHDWSLTHHPCTAEKITDFKVHQIKLVLTLQ